MLSEEVIHFFQNLSFTIVSSIDGKGRVHNSCKGLVKIESDGQVYLLDLYKCSTFRNLTRNSRISLTGVDEHKFVGYCLKGKARIADHHELGKDVIEAWENKVIGRITQRVINSIQGKKGHSHHPEAMLPKPAYLIVMQTEEVVDLAPAHLKTKGGKK